MLPPAYVLPFICFILISFPCMLGTVLENKSDRFLSKLESVEWNCLDIEDQKTLMLIIVFAQRVGSMTCFLMPLNFQTFVEVIF
jgi:hypothetical protein